MPQCAVVGSSALEYAHIESSLPHRRGPYLWVCAALSVYSLLFLIYAETRAFTWDESYHLVAAQLLVAGKGPYIDFCFPQTPWNAYWTAAWMRVLGLNWHVPHTFQALFTIGAVLLTADYVFFRFPVPRWRLAAALTAGLATGLNAMVFIYGPVAQTYGICLLALVAAFRISLGAIDGKGPVLAALTGLFAGIAASSSLLTAAAIPVFMGFFFFSNRAGSRSKKLAASALGAALPFAPVLWLFWLGPRQTWFNIFEYHAFYRKLYWPETTQHDLEVLTSWINSGQSLLLGLLAAFGLYYVAKRSQWPPTLKTEFYLCAWLAAALSAEISRAHPTFERYFLLTVPFLAILAAAGLYDLASRLSHPDHSLWPALVVAALLAIGLGRTLYDRGIVDQWSAYERLAKKINQVTPPDAPLFAAEPIYFTAKRLPPPGLELAYTHLISLPPAEEALLHINTRDELKRQVQSGKFATAASCDDDDIEFYGLKNLYKQTVDMEDCSIFWELKKQEIR
jgi:hypothetical protein